MRRKELLSLLVSLFLVGAVPLVVFLAGRVQDIRKRAYEAGGPATLLLMPGVGTYDLGADLDDIEIMLATGDETAQGVGLTLIFDPDVLEVRPGYEANPVEVPVGAPFDYVVKNECYNDDCSTGKIEFDAVVGGAGYSLQSVEAVTIGILRLRVRADVDPASLPQDTSVVFVTEDGVDECLVLTAELVDILGKVEGGSYTVGGEADCVSEGHLGNSFNGDVCCAGLAKISDLWPPDCSGVPDGSFICAYCPNGECGPGENYCNCLEDCWEPYATFEYKGSVYAFSHAAEAEVSWNTIIPGFPDSANYAPDGNAGDKGQAWCNDVLITSGADNGFDDWFVPNAFDEDGNRYSPDVIGLKFNVSIPSVFFHKI